MKRFLLMTLALLMLAMSVFAASSPSITDENMYDVEIIPTVPGVSLDGLVIKAIPETEVALKVIEQVQELAKGQPSFVNAVFADKIEEIKAVLVEGADHEAMKLQELTTLLVAGYKEEMGKLFVRLTFPTVFEEKDPVLVMIGMVEGEQVTWEPFEAKANMEGKIEMFMEAELLLKVQAGEAVIAVLK